MELILVDLSPVYQRLFHYIFGIKFCNEIYFCKEIPKGVIVNFYIIYLTNLHSIDRISMEHKMVRRNFTCGIINWNLKQAATYTLNYQNHSTPSQPSGLK